MRVIWISEFKVLCNTKCYILCFVLGASHDHALFSQTSLFFPVFSNKPSRIPYRNSDCFVEISVWFPWHFSDILPGEGTLKDALNFTSWEMFLPTLAGNVQNPTEKFQNQMRIETQLISLDNSQILFFSRNYLKSASSLTCSTLVCGQSCPRNELTHCSDGPPMLGGKNPFVPSWPRDQFFIYHWGQHPPGLVVWSEACRIVLQWSLSYIDTHFKNVMCRNYFMFCGCNATGFWRALCYPICCLTATWNYRMKTYRVLVRSVTAGWIWEWSTLECKCGQSLKLLDGERPLVWSSGEPLQVDSTALDGSKYGSICS